MTRFRCFFILFLFSIIIFSCSNSVHNPLGDDDTSDTSGSPEKGEHIKRVKKIFYNVPSPIEMAGIMQRAGATYNPELLNSINNGDKYNTNSRMALNLGVYGADLSYTRMFDEIQESVNYLAAIRKLSDGLGIPQSPGTFAVKRIEQNIQNKDSLMLIISDIYSAADIYLKESNRGSTAALIILGGWIEALYVASNIVDERNPNKEIMERIAEQKYSLNNLIDLLSTYNDNEVINYYLPLLQNLKTCFDKIEIVTTRATVTTDSVKKTTSISSTSQIKITFENVKEISNVVKPIRKEIVK